MEKEEILKLIEWLDSDSKSKSEKASDKLVEIFEPKIKAWAEIVYEYTQEHISTYGDYEPSRGRIVSVSHYKTGNEFCFCYKDVCCGEVIGDYIYVNVDDIMDENFLNKVKKMAIDEAIETTNNLISEYTCKLNKEHEKLAMLQGLIKTSNNTDK